MKVHWRKMERDYTGLEETNLYESGEEWDEKSTVILSDDSD